MGGPPKNKICAGDGVVKNMQGGCKNKNVFGGGGQRGKNLNL